VLCLDVDASTESVRENYRLLMALLHPDRQEGAAEPEWPTGCAQRVNEAYAVLSDAARRHEYDLAGQRAHVAREREVEFVPEVRIPRARRRPRLLRSFAIVSAVLAVLFLFQAWWVTETPRHYALLERSLGVQSSAAWMRDVLSEGLPRFLEVKPVVSFEPIALLEPPKAPRRMMAWVPASDVRAVTSQAPDAASSSPRPTEPEDALPRRSAATVQAASAGPATPVVPASPLVLAQAATAARPASSGGTPANAQEIELLVARLVSCYEQGDADALMALFASGEPGFWKGYRVRNAYADFFRATRGRQLRMNRLEWQSSSDRAQARGEATLVADYSDGSGHVERRIPVELDIALRDGQAHITRLNLYPEPK